MSQVRCLFLLLSELALLSLPKHLLLKVCFTYQFSDEQLLFLWNSLIFPVSSFSLTLNKGQVSNHNPKSEARIAFSTENFPSSITDLHPYVDSFLYLIWVYASPSIICGSPDLFLKVCPDIWFPKHKSMGRAQNITNIKRERETMLSCFWTTDMP